MNSFTTEQYAAIYTLGCNIAVSAGAGAGKTRVLVERYFNLLQQRIASPKEIAAITFTNKAAKEMKERIRTKVLQKINESTGEEKKYWQNVKQELEYAYICTIDSLCGQIIRDNPVETGIDPQFSVLDEVENIILLDDAVAEVFYAALEEKKEWLDFLLKHYSKQQLLSGIKCFYECFEELKFSGVSLTAVLEPYKKCLGKMEEYKSDCINLLHELTECIHDITGKVQKEQVKAIADNWQIVREAIQGYDKHEQHSQSLQIINVYVKCLRSAGAQKELISKIKETLTLLEDAYISSFAVKIIPYMYEFLSQIFAAVQRKKTTKQQFSFGDIVFKTLTLLSEHREVAARYMQRFKQIMVDEFQDTDDVQRQIIYLLASGDKEVLAKDKLFIVGDAKQSIYRFRGADVAVFRRVINDVVKSGGQYITLDKNFRTVKELLDIYNDIFSVLMSTAYDDINFKRLEYHYCAESVPCAGLIVINGQERSAYDARCQEAQAITAKIEALKNEKNYNYGDFALLFRSTTDIEIYEQALKEANIPYYVVQGKGFFQQQEITDILNLLMMLDNCYNDAAAAGVLRSPFFSLSDQTLVLLKAYGKTLWNGLLELNQIQELTEDERQAADFAFSTISQLRQLKGRVNLSDLLERVWQLTGYKKYLLSEYMGMQKYANVEKFEVLAADFEKKDLYTLGDFIRYVRAMIEHEAREEEAQIESETGNTVKLMTVHKSKGLEFPVVVIPDMHRGKNDNNGGIFNYSKSHGIGIKLVDSDGMSYIETKTYKTIKEEDAVLEALELKRVLYVAMTRAKEYLVLTYVGDKEDKRKKKTANNFAKDFIELSSWAKWLQKIYRYEYIDDMDDILKLNDGIIQVEKDFPVLVKDSKTTWIEKFGQMEKPAERFSSGEAFNINTAPIETENNDVAIISATALGYFNRCPRSYFYKYKTGLAEISCEHEGHGTSGAVIGTAVHRFCELLLNKSAYDKALSQALEEVPCEFINTIKNDVRQLTEKFFHSSLYRQVSSLKAEAEVRFKVKISLFGEEIIVNGSIDCLVYYDDGTLGIIDYKTDRLDFIDTKEKASQYDWQLALYIIAAQKISGRKVKDAKIYFVRTDTIVNMEVTEEKLNVLLKEISKSINYICGHSEECDFERMVTNCKYCGYQYCCRD